MYPCGSPFLSSLRFTGFIRLGQGCLYRDKMNERFSSNLAEASIGKREKYRSCNQKI